MVEVEKFDIFVNAKLARANTVYKQLATTQWLAAVEEIYIITDEQRKLTKATSVNNVSSNTTWRLSK